jgi:hypothetical protein
MKNVQNMSSERVPQTVGPGLNLLKKKKKRKKMEMGVEFYTPSLSSPNLKINSYKY